MKFLIDMPVTPDAGPHLRAAGHDAIHAVEVPAFAQREDRVVITADLDSHLTSNTQLSLLIVRVSVAAPCPSASSSRRLVNVTGALVSATPLTAVRIPSATKDFLDHGCARPVA